jgi:hypothetical protein
VTDFCEHSDETSGSIKIFFDKLSDNQLLKYSASWSE